MLPLIGVTSFFYKDREDKSNINGVRRNYLKAISMAGGLPIILPISDSKLEIEELISRFDGIMIPGGNDIDPCFYQEQPHPKLETVDKERDEFEIQVARLCYAVNKPLLGICRGLQAINVALGGTLIQDLESDGYDKISHSKSEHEVLVETNSKLFAISNSNTILVNSLHHQAIKNVAKDLFISCRSSDGVVEGIEAPNKNFYLGIQWHPEALVEKGDEISINLFKSFINAATES